MRVGVVGSASRVRSRFLVAGAEPSISKLPFISSSRMFLASFLRITLGEIRVSTSGSAEAGFLVQKLLQFLHAGDVSFESATGEVVVRKRSDETVVDVLDAVQQQLYADGRSEITVRLDAPCPPTRPCSGRVRTAGAMRCSQSPRRDSAPPPLSMCLGAFTNISS